MKYQQTSTTSKLTLRVTIQIVKLYREGFDREVLMKPGDVHKIVFPVGWMTQIFNKGHRIRVTITSIGAPLYEPNSQTGKPLTMEFPCGAVKAVNTIHHNPQHASRIIAPVAR